jgi:hypothetical protein
MNLNEMIINLLDNYPELKGEIVNILLVSLKGRKATLIETANFKDTLGIKEGLDIIKKVIFMFEKLSYPLKITYDLLSPYNYPRYFVTLNNISAPVSHPQIGRLLEMHCFNQTFYDHNQDRYGVSIDVILPSELKRKDNKDEEIQIYAEMGIISLTNKSKLIQSIEKKITNYTKVMEGILPINFTYSINTWYSTPTLISKLKERDIDFIFDSSDLGKKKLQKRYYNFIVNEFEEEEAEEILDKVEGIRLSIEETINYLLEKISKI